MAERYTVVDRRPLTYEGYFRPQDLYALIKRFLLERAYVPVESENFEEVFEHGRQVTVELRPFKKLSDYVQKELVIKITMFRLREETVSLDGVKRKVSEGKVEFICDASIVSDYKSKWEGSGWLYLLRTINDKFIRKDWSSSARKEVEQDLDDLLEEVRAHLNMIRFKQ